MGQNMANRIKIERIDVFPTRYPAVAYFKFLRNGRAAVIIKITADDGTVGWGQSVPVPSWCYETLEAATVAIRDYLAPALIGHDVFDLDTVHRTMNREICPSFSTGMPLAKAGIDMALHDLIGRLAGLSLAQLWGRPSGGEVTLSWTLNPRTLDEVESLIEEGALAIILSNRYTGDDIAIESNHSPGDIFLRFPTADNSVFHFWIYYGDEDYGYDPSVASPGEKHPLIGMGDYTTDGRTLYLDVEVDPALLSLGVDPTGGRERHGIPQDDEERVKIFIIMKAFGWKETDVSINCIVIGQVKVLWILNEF